MDFIERLFHVAPDGGNGSLEAVYLAVGAVLIGVALFRRRIGAWLRRRRESRR